MRISPQIPAVYKGDEEMQAAFIVSWWIENPRTRHIVGGSSDWEAFSEKEFRQACDTVMWWREGAMACAGAYAGGEADMLVDAAEWIYTKESRLQEIKKEIDKLRQEEREIRFSLGLGEI